VEECKPLVRGAGVQHCTAAAPFRHRLAASFEGAVSMAGGLLHLRGLGGDCLRGTSPSTLRNWGF